MSSEDIAYSIVGLIFIVLISAFALCMVGAVYFYFTETPVPPSAEEIKQIHEKYQEERSDKAAWLCFAALGAFILGWLTSKAQFHTVGVCLIVGAFAWDYKVAATALFVWYFIVPALVVMGIVSLFKRS